MGATFSSSNKVTPSNQSSPNLSTHIQDHAGSTISHDENEIYYDMSRRKYLFILSQETFERTRHFDGKRPSTRLYTDKDTKKLKEVFGEILGFKVYTLRNKRYSEIIDILDEIASMDHTSTSCISLAILTHGGKGGKVYAADRPYQLDEIVSKLTNLACLAKIPKLFFVQACRGKRLDVGHTVSYGQSDLGFATPATSETSLSPLDGFKSYFDILRAFSIYVGADDNDASHRQHVRVETVPTHMDCLVVQSSVEGYVSYRRENYGSWMIQALCDTIRDHHKNLDLLSMVTLMNKKVSKMSTFDNLKQSPVTSFNMTKLFIFESYISHILGDSNETAK